MIIKSYSHCGTGKTNEDYLIYKELSNDCTVAILADGMGGLSHGDLAAQIVVNTVMQVIEKQLKTLNPTDLLQTAVHQANEAICTKSHELRCKMGAAMAILLIIENKAYFSWLGNVRIYLKENNDIKQLTIDHVINIENNNLYLTRCVNGKKFREEPPLGMVNLTQTMHLLLCTDGFYQSLTPENICRFGADAVNFIIEAVDNFSVVELIIES